VTDTPSADDLRREIERLRNETAQVVRERAAESVGLDPRTARWIEGDTLEEAKADAAKLARLANAHPARTHTRPASPDAELMRRHGRGQHEQTAAIFAADTEGDTTR
jgi:hypothetical protein